MGKIPVAVLGATGTVGQRLLCLLANHPWFEPVLACASDRSAGKPYAEAANWTLDTPIPDTIRRMTVSSCRPDASIPLAFSALDSGVAGGIEEAWAESGGVVVSNARNHRMRADVPLVVPEINADHLALARGQPYGRGCIVTNPNCSTIGLVLALKPLADAFGLEAVSVTTLQAASGAGYPGVPSLDLIDNVVPFIAGEEEKLETEPGKILGRLSTSGDAIAFHDAVVSASCYRVPVTDGHSESVSVRLSESPDARALVDAMRGFRGHSAARDLPSSPSEIIVYRVEENRPQPRLDRGAGKGMSVVVGRLRPCPVLGWKFSLLSHNTLRGAAGGTILLAELCVKKGMVPGA